MEKEDVKEILCQQMQLLAEKSKEIKTTEKGSMGSLVDISNAICRLSDSYENLSRIRD